MSKYHLKHKADSELKSLKRYTDYNESDCNCDSIAISMYEAGYEEGQEENDKIIDELHQQINDLNDEIKVYSRELNDLRDLIIDIEPDANKYYWLRDGNIQWLPFKKTDHGIELPQGAELDIVINAIQKLRSSE